ncbi:dihydrolipoyllysine-residue acetyltransferase [Marinimicrobium sp. ABcell2]|uniref:dihydrolipoyllysine-residue acetyltransferase n=1 Tax=Marinimicrobium sp. ABcell2 TaxID=3069751 RepID=UPI0027B77CD3|nr:dihydrolipoyllysine-residue acetyltransferase [Marinimicrobium sp. ABcell2]MDQ2075353.1 dihydrolipoyllysine-residue acetyltransferase [Marinimicrobium sp. ABcell2]
MAIETIKVPDIGGSDDVEVIEISVSVGDTIDVEDTLIVLETDKASMDIPSTLAGKVTAVKVKEGDKVSEGSAIVEVETAGEASASDEKAEPESEQKTEQKAEEKPAAAEQKSSASSGSQEIDVPVPDIGGSEGVEVIEVAVSVGDEVSEGDSLIVLETDKASMEIPAPASGTITSIALKEGDKVSQGDLIGKMKTAGGSSEQPSQAAPAPAKSESASSEAKSEAAPEKPASDSGSPATAAGASSEVINSGDVYAGPAVRRLGRQLGVDLAKVKGSGPRGRVSKDDVRDYVKNIVTASQSGAAPAGGGAIPRPPAVDFAKFGEIETVKMSKIKKLTADNMTRSWLNVPHVTQWDDVDITEMEAFRKGLKAEAEKRGSKLTPLPFLLKACAAALAAEPSFNVSLHHDGEQLVHKKYIHIGIAVDTPNGLMVPVIRDVDKKGLWELTDEINAMAKKARDGKLTALDMQGGCFTISSLGAMGGSGFTPIVNTPEVGILGVSRAQMKPVWNGSEFVPRNMLPISLSYDHRAINGADAGRFFTYLSSVISDVRRLLL